MITHPFFYLRLAPGLRGLGYGMVTIPTVMNFYYTVVMAYAVYFLFMGFASELPWDRCNHEYNTMNCYSLPDRDYCHDEGIHLILNHILTHIMNHKSLKKFNIQCR